MCKIKKLDLRLLCCSWGAHVLTTLSCFLNMETINEMVENEEPHNLIMDRIIKGKDLKPWIGMAWVVNTDSPIRRCTQTECYLEWDFARTMSRLGLTRIKNLYVNPDFGKEGLHSEYLELHCT